MASEKKITEKIVSFIKWKSYLFIRNHGKHLPDKLYLKLVYWLIMNKPLNLHDPKSFTEKMQWLKLYNRRPEYTIMVDKYAVKDYVANIIGVEYIIPTLGVWNNYEEIDFDSLPNRFVLKTTQAGGGMGVVVCNDKTELNHKKVKKILENALRFDNYAVQREWPYKNVPARILAEEYIVPEPGELDLSDYKWYCFNGVPRYCQVIKNRHSTETIDFFDTEWNHQVFVGLNPLARPASVTPLKPANLETHLFIARKLSKGIPFSRIDLYEVGNKTYFGEITLFPAAGFGRFTPDQYNDILGNMVELPDEKVVD